MAKPKKTKTAPDGPLPDSEKERAVDMAVSQIERQFGRGAIMKLGAGGVIPNVKSISTGSLGLDIAIGVGGNTPGKDNRDFRP